MKLDSFFFAKKHPREKNHSELHVLGRCLALLCQRAEKVRFTHCPFLISTADVDQPCRLHTIVGGNYTYLEYGYTCIIRTWAEHTTTGFLCDTASIPCEMCGTHSQATSTLTWFNQTKGRCSGLIGSESIRMSKPRYTPRHRPKSYQTDAPGGTRHGHG